MEVKKYFKNIKSQKGVTGADIVIAVSIIVFTIAIVSMLYVNTTLGSRNVTRTAGATRIATNILENIEKLSYNEFITNFDTQIVSVGTKQTTEEFLDYYTLNGDTDLKVFSTKIPKGYTLYIKSEPNYGTHVDTNEQFDLVRDISIIITFSVGDQIEKIEFNTVKTREIIEETNVPSTEYLTSSGILGNGMNYYPVKYLDNANAYIKINENDNSWYNYSNKEWATVIVSKMTEDEIFDVNGKFIGTIDTTKSNSTYTEKFVWIPRFFTKTVDEITEFYTFAYLGSGTNKIISTILESQGTENKATLTLNTFENIEETEAVNTETTNFEGKTGKWVSAEGDSIKNDMDANLLNESKYGPYIAY